MNIEIIVVFWEMTVSRGRDRLTTKINITFFVGNEVLNIFYLTIFLKKKNNIFENNQKKFFRRRDHFRGKGASDDKNEYNLFHGNWGTEYCL